MHSETKIESNNTTLVGKNGNSWVANLATTAR